MINNQAQLFLVFIINGIIIGIFFDFFRILRKSFKTSDFTTYIEDFLFWILTGFSILFTLFKFNNGEIRLYMFFAIAIGILFYILIFSSYIIKLNVSIIFFLKKTIKKILFYIYIPIKFILKTVKKIIFKPISFTFINIKSLYTNLSKFNTKNVNKIKN